jgi:hypothetical protein
MRIKNWNKFQHFKDRRPPWIKLYRDILDDVDWHELDGDSAKALVAIWLIASEDDKQQGTLPDTRTLAFRLRITESKVNQLLTKLSKWLIQDDNDVISSGYQVDLPETETETERKTETETKKKAVACPSDVSPDCWEAFITHRKAVKALVTDRVVNTIRNEADKAGIPLEDALDEVVARGWRGFKAEWYKPQVRTEQPRKTQHQLNEEATARALGLIPKKEVYDVETTARFLD